MPSKNPRASTFHISQTPSGWVPLGTSPCLLSACGSQNACLVIHLALCSGHTWSMSPSCFLLIGPISAANGCCYELAPFGYLILKICFTICLYHVMFMTSANLVMGPFPTNGIIIGPMCVSSVTGPHHPIGPLSTHSRESSMPTTEPYHQACMNVGRRNPIGSIIAISFVTLLYSSNVISSG